MAFGVLGTHLYVGSAPLANIFAAADALADFTGLSVASEVGQIESMGNLGKKFQSVTFQAIADGRTIKLKGGYDPGSLPLVVASDTTDAGQILLEGYANAANQNNYPFLITLNGNDPANGAIWFGGLVMSYERVISTVNNVLKANVQIEVNTPIILGPA